ncbi:hypothetical protein JW766_02030 [Candidatus Dojkabacteria bacterium]|nr:hypothetical protein [Candidatus Dojkabacteria bacterium]
MIESAPSWSKRNKRILLFCCSCILILLVCIVVVTTGYWVYYTYFKSRGGPLIYELTLEGYNLEESDSIDFNGGVIKVNDTSSPLYGAKVEIAEGSLTESESVEIGYSEIQIVNIPEDMEILGEMVVLEKTKKDELFNYPVAVTLPFDKSRVKNGELVGVYEYDEDTGYLQSTTLADYDEENGTITILITHFSKLVRIKVSIEGKLKKAISNGYDTGFRVNEDGFFISNWGSFETYGNCLGMSSMAKFQYVYKKRPQKTFYERYRVGLKDEEFDDEAAQELVGRIDVKLEPRFLRMQEDMFRFGKGYYSLNKYYPMYVLQNMVVTGQPELLYLRKANYVTDPNGYVRAEFVLGNNHAVLAYKYEDGYMHIYDPNFPYRRGADENRNDRKIKFSYDRGFDTYYSGLTSEGSKYTFDVFIPFASNFVIGNREMRDLLTLSLEGFSDGYYPDITIDYPKPENIVISDSVTIRGNIFSEKYKAASNDYKYIHAYYKSSTSDKDHRVQKISSDGSFSINVPLLSGENVIHLVAGGQAENTGWAAYKKVIVNLESFAKEGSPPPQYDPIDTCEELWERGKVEYEVDFYAEDPKGGWVHCYDYNEDLDIFCKDGHLDSIEWNEIEEDYAKCIKYLNQ